MQLIASRSYSFIETGSLEHKVTNETLVRDRDGTLILHIAERAGLVRSDERVVHLGLREALIWINEPSDGSGSFWD